MRLTVEVAIAPSRLPLIGSRRKRLALDAGVSKTNISETGRMVFDGQPLKSQEKTGRQGETPCPRSVNSWCWSHQPALDGLGESYRLLDVREMPTLREHCQFRSGNPLRRPAQGADRVMPANEHERGNGDRGELLLDVKWGRFAP